MRAGYIVTIKTRVEWDLEEDEVSVDTLRAYTKEDILDILDNTFGHTYELLEGAEHYSDEGVKIEYYEEVE